MMSMTGFAALEASSDGAARSWDIRSVNARGLDIRLRLPEQGDDLEKHVRAAIGACVARGNVSLTLRIGADGAAAGVQISPHGLATALKAVAQAEQAAMDAGVSLAPSTATAVLALRGVMEAGQGAAPQVPLAVLKDELEALLHSFNAMRGAEGAQMRQVLGAQVNRIADLTQQAVDLAPERAAHMAKTYKAAMARVLDAAVQVDADKLSQDIAALAVKADVTEEIDRLGAHIVAARALLDTDGPVGRKLDFLTQEFNREANTLCSKAQMPAMTAIGLELKTVIDQMREQVQNVE